MASVTLDRATCILPGAARPAVDGIDLHIDPGEMLVLLGPAESGKSTILRLVAGLEDLTSGHIYIGERDCTNIPGSERDVVLAFQSYALYPHMTVAENMDFPLRISRVPEEEIGRRVHKAAAELELTGLLDELPEALTSAQRQRVALARGLVREPRVLLMDEPLASMDPEVRADVHHHIRQLQANLGVTTLYATSNEDEATQMGCRIAVLDQGRVVRILSPHPDGGLPASGNPGLGHLLNAADS